MDRGRGYGGRRDWERERDRDTRARERPPPRDRRERDRSRDRNERRTTEPRARVICALGQVDRSLAQLRTRYPARLFPACLTRMTADWVNAGPLKFSGGEVVATDGASGAVATQSAVDGFDAAAAVHVRVLLLQTPILPTRHLLQRLKLVVAKMGAARMALYGGPCTDEEDGDVTAHNAHVKAACRHLLAQAGVDLSDLPPESWTSFATLHTKQKGEGGAEAVRGKTIVLYPTLNRPLRLSPVQRSEVVTEDVPYEEQEEEEVEEPVSAEDLAASKAALLAEDDAAGLTEEELRALELKLPRTKKVVRTVTKTRRRTEQRALKLDWIEPAAFSVDTLRTNRGDGCNRLLELLMVSDCVEEAVRKQAGEAIAEAAQAFVERVSRVDALKRKREEEAEEHERLREDRRRRLQTEADEVRAKMQSAWLEEDEGKTEDEIREVQASREDRLREAVAKLRQRSSTPPAEPVEGAEPPGTNPHAPVRVDRELVSYFSILDFSASDLGDSPHEYCSKRCCSDLILSAVGSASQDAVSALCNALASDSHRGRIMYRMVTDVAEPCASPRGDAADSAAAATPEPCAAEEEREPATDAAEDEPPAADDLPGADVPPEDGTPDRGGDILGMDVDPDHEDTHEDDGQPAEAGLAELEMGWHADDVKETEESTSFGVDPDQDPAAAEGCPTGQDWAAVTYKDLQQACKARGLKASGKAEELRARLAAHK